MPPADLNHPCPICKKEMPSRNLPRHIVSHKKHIGEFMDEKHIKHALDTKSSLISGGLDPKTKKYAFVYCLSCDEGRNEYSKQAVKTFYTGDTSHRKVSPQCFTDKSFDKIKKYFEKPGKIKPKAEPKEKPKEEAKEEAKAESEKTNEIITDISDTTKKSLEDWYSEYHKDDEPDSDEEEPNFEDKILEIIKVYNSMVRYAKKRNEELEKIKEETKGIREKNLLIEEQKEKIKDLEKQVRLLKYDAELMEKHLP